MATGLELHAEYGPDDIVSTKLWQDTDADEQIAGAADAWRRTLLAKGFREIAK